MSEPAKVTEITMLCGLCGLKQHGGDCLSAVKDELYMCKLALDKKNSELAEARTEIERLNKVLTDWNPLKNREYTLNPDTQSGLPMIPAEENKDGNNV